MNYVGLSEGDRAKVAFEMARGLAPEYVQSRLDGISIYRKPEDRKRQVVFLRIAAGLEDPGAADALR